MIELFTPKRSRRTHRFKFREGNKSLKNFEYMTKRELYKRIKDGAVYGHEASYGTHYSIWLGEGNNGKDYIFFQNYGRWASKVSYEEFATSFAVAWSSANEFLKTNHEL